VADICTCIAASAGINLRLRVEHPFTGQSIPVFAADYVVSEYGTQAVMGVPAHDGRDRLFADEHHLPSVVVNNASENGGVLLNSDRVRKVYVLNFVNCAMTLYLYCMCVYHVFQCCKLCCKLHTYICVYYVFQCSCVINYIHA